IELTADFYLQLENFSPAQVFENRIEASLAGSAPAEGLGKLAALAQPFLDAVAEPTATPGGGSVAALAGALGASLGQMVAGLSRKKKSQAAYVDQLSDALAEFQTGSRALAEAIDRDAASFSRVMAAYKLPKDTSELERQRDAAIQQALHGAASVPLEVARQAAEVFDRLGQLEAISSPSMYSDIRVGRLLAAAAVRGALENVVINLESITDSAFASRLRAESAALAARVSETPVSAGR
ncbi:MAG: cyclodeaminase/cyclohydrolase family protein, partial [Candidatus Acidiferrales bacterium]